jgi:predicted nucleic acid-binding protein
MQADYRVVLDSCVLANYGVCDLFLRLAENPRMYLPRWSSTILDEVQRTQTTQLNWPKDLADYFRQQINAAFPEACVTGHELLLPAMQNDAKDKHVLAAAIKGRAELIVTFNLKHFPPAALNPWGLAAAHPQDYLLTLLSMNSGLVIARLAETAQKRNRDLQDHAIHLGKSVPAFSAKVLQLIGAA